MTSGTPTSGAVLVPEGAGRYAPPVWISVDIGLPFPGDAVLTWHYTNDASPSVVIARRRGEGLSMRWHSVPGKYDVQGVTHWQPLPGAPAESEIDAAMEGR